jgi:hypothetical protein
MKAALEINYFLTQSYHLLQPLGACSTISEWFLFLPKQGVTVFLAELTGTV